MPLRAPPRSSRRLVGARAPDPGTGKRRSWQGGGASPRPLFPPARAPEREGRLETPRPTTAFIGTLFVGTERLERPMTESEKKDLSARLREHDYVHASL